MEEYVLTTQKLPTPIYPLPLNLYPLPPSQPKSLAKE